MKTYKISVYKNGHFIRDIWADFPTKKAALLWTIETYKSIDVILNPKEITIIDPLNY